MGIFGTTYVLFLLLGCLAAKELVGKLEYLESTIYSEVRCGLKKRKERRKLGTPQSISGGSRN